MPAGRCGRDRQRNVDAAQEENAMQDENKPVTGEWGEAGRQAERTWDREPDKDRHAPMDQNHESMERTEEGYGTGKNGADPGADHDGTTPADPPG